MTEIPSLNQLEQSGVTSPRTVRMPAEWETHRATWIAWPHFAEDWPDKISAVHWVYSEIARALAHSEQLEVICHSEEVQARAEECLTATGVVQNVRFHIAPTNRSWLRDSFPTWVWNGASPAWMRWKFNAWAKYDNYQDDQLLPDRVSQITQTPLINAVRPDNGAPLVLEGGAIDVNGTGSLLTTEECLLSTIQERNPGLTREGYEQAFSEYLGISNLIWLAGSCAGDDTHGHVDDAARFVNTDTVVVAVENNACEENFELSQRNLSILKRSTTEDGKPLNIVTLPMPAPRFYYEDRLPASYANFYIANKSVIVPTFNDPNDSRAISILRELFPKHEVIGIHAVDLVLGYGTLHCLTQQEPLGG